MQSFKNIKGLILLLLYLVSSNPSVLFHHHEEDVVIAFSHADECEKAIFYSKSEEACHHKAHFTAAHEECFFCDHHTFSTHALLSFESMTFKKIQLEKDSHLPFTTDFHTAFVREKTNKGPPIS